MHDPLQPPRRISRVLVIGGFIGLTAVVIGGGYWLHTRQKAFVQLPKADPQEMNGSKPGLVKPKYATARTTDNGADDERARWRKLLQEFASLRGEIETLKRQPKSIPASTPQTTSVTTSNAPIKRPAPFFVSQERGPAVTDDRPMHTLAPGTWIPCSVETSLHSEIEGYFTVKTRRVVSDTATFQHPLIPQGLSIVAKAVTSSLLLGNERIPTFALTLSLPNGSSLDLGEAPIVDGTGTNGLTGTVDNHIWRLIWTSVFIGGLQGGQQVLQQQLGSDGTGPIASGIGRQSERAAQQRLGRAQDTRPTIEVTPGQACNILVVKPLRLPHSAVSARSYQ